MSNLPLTRPSLLVRLRDPDDEDAWAGFTEAYVPLLYRYVARYGLQEADAADVTQDILGRVLRAFRGGAFEHRAGSFRGWLLAVARNCVRDALARQRSHHQATGDSADLRLLDAQPAPEEEQAWEADYRRRAFHWAAAKVRAQVQESTWTAFWGVAVEGRDSRAVAEELGISVGAVYLAKSRVLAQIRHLVRQLDESPTALGGEDDDAKC